MMPEIIFRVVEIILQIILVIFAGAALFTWKREIRGRDKYKLARGLLDYIKELRFLIHTKGGSLHQIVLNDILIDRNHFYNDRLSLIGKEKVYFHQSIFGLFNHIDPRANVFVPKRIRTFLYEVYPESGKWVGTKNDPYTYIQVIGAAEPNIENLEKNKEDFEDCIYEMFSKEGVTIKEYFMKWEKLLIELQKLT